MDFNNLFVEKNCGCSKFSLNRVYIPSSRSIIIATGHASVTADKIWFIRTTCVDLGCRRLVVCVFQRNKFVASFQRQKIQYKVQRFCWPKGTSLECTELIYRRLLV